MNSIHDLGGMTCFGPIQAETQEPVFHTPWERQVFAMLIVTLGQRFYNLDELRHGIERMDPAHYLASTYYEHWLAGLQTILVEKGLVTTEELETGVTRDPPNNAIVLLRPAEVATLVQHGGSAQRQQGRITPRFHTGDRVLARNLHPSGHTRIPRYVRGKQGVVERVHGTFVTPDAHAHGHGEQPQPLYCVRFTASTLWGPSASARDSLYIDLWEDYLEKAGR